METRTKIAVSKALRGTKYAMVAKLGSYEVWAHKARLGIKGARYVSVTFEVIRIIVATPPRRFEAIPVPETMRSDLKKVLAYVETLVPKA